MINVTNRFGEGVLYQGDDLQGKIYCLCCACMSIYSEFLGWANAHPDRMTKDPYEADNIVVLGCQVTDLAVLNDVRNMEYLIMKYPNAKIFAGGCLGRRFDIDVPAYRLDNLRQDYQPLDNRNLIDFSKPFWVKDSEWEFHKYSKYNTQGRLFRDMYPLRIGVGCHRKCTYCTINTTRGNAYQLEPDKLKEELLGHANVVLIADNPHADQLKEIFEIVYQNRKVISIRNIEPDTAVSLWGEIKELARVGLLDTFHCPIQSSNSTILRDMGRSFATVEKLYYELQSLPDVFLATNIIIDYKNNIFGGETFENLSEVLKQPFLVDVFDYVSWNPYWDGTWDRAMGEERYKRYIGE